jgi:beta-lactamase regulating signal transducer with metallopeptidase domain
MIVLLALLNTLWQTAAVALLAWAALRSMPRVNAATRAAIWWAVLAFIVLLPVMRGLPDQSPAPRVSASAAIPPAAVFTPVAAQPVRRNPPARVLIYSNSWPQVLLALWCVFSFLQCVRLSWSYLHLRALKRRAWGAPAEQRFAFDARMSTCRIGRPVRLLVTNAVPMPVAVGFRHPAVILPKDLLTRLTPAELDHVLLHELAHLARRDDWTNLLARLAGAILAFHPVATLVLRQIERERELACDDWVVAATGSPRPYAASLARLFELCTSRKTALLASGIADGGSHLGDRIALLLRRGREFSPRASALRVTACTAALLMLVLAGARAPSWIAFAQSRRPNSQDEGRVVGVAREPSAAPARNSLLAALVANGYGDISVDDIISLKVQGITAEYVTGMSRSGIGKLPPRDLIDLKVQGVRPEFIRDILGLGFGPYTPREFIDLKVHGVPVELFRALEASGFQHAGAREIIDAKVSGLQTGHLREASKYGPNLTLQQILRMKQSGVL